MIMKLRLDPDNASLNRRVAAVLTFLRSYDPKA